jgi:predicted nucleotidyltransferase
MADVPLSRSLTDRIRPALRTHGVVRAALFGSVARGTSGPSSDVDLLVEFAPGASLLDLAALELDLTTLLGRPVEVVTYRSLDARVRERVLNEQVPLL